MDTRRELACAWRKMKTPNSLPGYWTNEPPPRSAIVRPRGIECDRLPYLMFPKRKIEVQISTGIDQTCLEIHRTRLTQRTRPTQLPRSRPMPQRPGSNQLIYIERQSMLDQMARFS